MKSMVMDQWGDPANLRLHDSPDRKPGPGEVEIEVRAAGCNFFDTLIVRGQYQVRPELPFAPGAEISGVVRAVGEGVTRFSPGARVLAFLDWGGYATQAIARESDVFPIPDDMSFEDAAGFGIVYQTSYFALVDRANLARGDVLLVHAAAGGVGLAALQIGRALGARVFGTAGTEEKCALASSHGAERCFVSSDASWVDAVKSATNGRGADVIYDPVGGDTFDQSLKCVSFGGRILVIGFASGRIPSIPANKVLLKNIAIVGLHWGNYRRNDAPRIRAVMESLFEMRGEGALRPVIAQKFPLERAADALAALGSRQTVGKVVLVP